MDCHEKIPVRKLLSNVWTQNNFPREVRITFLLGSFHAGLCAAIFACDTNKLTESRLFVQYLNVCLVYSWGLVSVAYRETDIV